MIKNTFKFDWGFPGFRSWWLHTVHWKVFLEPIETAEDDGEAEDGAFITQ